VSQQYLSYHVPAKKQNIHVQSGFLLPAAIFLLVTLAGLGALAVNISASQQNASIQDVQGARAYHAARGGVEWAAQQIMQNDPTITTPPCPANTTLTLGAFAVAVQCALTSYTQEGGSTYISVYEINSTATFGTVNTQNYIERQIDLTMSRCSDGANFCE
jgi:MSHA biogenesis protein MshP